MEVSILAVHCLTIGLLEYCTLGRLLQAAAPPSNNCQGSACRQRVPYLCMQKFQKLADGMPWSKHVHSKLVCAITREIMNEHNPPMVLPNGAVYSEKAVQQVASRNHNIFTCPKTGTHVRSCHRSKWPYVCMFLLIT